MESLADFISRHGFEKTDQLAFDKDGNPVFFLSPDATSFTLVGAIHRYAHDNKLSRRVVMEDFRVALGIRCFSLWSKQESTTKEDVVAVARRIRP